MALPLIRRFGLLALCLPAFAGAVDGERITLVSDLNGRYGSADYNARVHDAAAAIIADAPDLVVSTGDMVAGQAPGGLEDGTRRAMWAAFHAAFADPLAAAGVPLAVTPGNHDASAYPGFEADRSGYEAHWRSAAPGDLLPGSEWPWRYALRRGGLLLITFDGTVPGAVPSRERTFVARMLEAHGAAAEWTLVFSHLPFWPLARERETELLDDPDFLTLLHDHGVDAYASGHHHLHYAGVDDAGMLHLAVGALGGNARAFAAGGERQPHAFAELERRGDRLLVRRRAAPDFDRAADFLQVPERIAGPPGWLRRADGPVALRD